MAGRAKRRRSNEAGISQAEKHERGGSKINNDCGLRCAAIGGSAEKSRRHNVILCDNIFTI